MKSVSRVFASAILIQIMFLGTACAQEHSGGASDGEEDGRTQFKKSQTYDVVKNGVRFVLKYDEAKSAFVGTIENKSEKVVYQAHVDVHISNGVELGPTTPKDLKPGETIPVKLSAKGQKFETWSTHAEVCTNEHGHGEGGDHGHEGGDHEHEGGEHEHGEEGTP